MLVQSVRRWWLLVLVLLMAAGAATLVSAQRLETRSTVTAVVAAGPRPDATVSAALVSLLLTKYVAFAASPALAERLGEELGQSSADISEGLEVSLPERTTTIRIAVTADDTATAVEVASAVAEAVVERSTSDRYLSVELVVPAEAGSATEQTGRSRLLAVGLVAGLVVALAAAVLVEAVARRRRGRA